MKSEQIKRWGILAVVAVFLALSHTMIGCNKKDDPKLTTSGGGVSTQSVIALKGAAR